MIQEAETATEVLGRMFVETSALGFQSVVTSILAIACYVLWRRQRGDYFATWAAAWAAYVVRLVCISAFLVAATRPGCSSIRSPRRHRPATAGSGAALARGFVLRPIHAVPSRARSPGLDHGLRHGRMLAGSISATVLLTSVTLWTGVIFWRARERCRAARAGARRGVHAVGPPPSRLPAAAPLGAAVLYGVFADVLFIFAIGIGRCSSCSATSATASRSAPRSSNSSRA